jgi:hypothetical protein
MGSRFLIWSGAGLAVAATVGLAALFAVAGLGRADEVASVSGAFIGLAGLGVSVFGLVQARSDAAPGHADDDAGRQAVSGSTVSGRTVQVSKSAGGVTVRPSPRAPVPPAATAAGTQDAAAPTAAAPTAAAPTAPATGAGYGPGQSVSDSRVGGDVVQIAGADGDVEIG